MAAAGLRDSTSWALRIPALLAIVAATALFSIDLVSEDPSRMYGGAAGGHKEPLSDLFKLIFVLLGAGALVGGLLSRVRTSSMLWFNVASATVAGLAISVAGLILEPTEHAFGLWTVIGILILTGNLAVGFVLFQFAGGLLGRLLQRGAAGVWRRLAPAA